MLHAMIDVARYRIATSHRAEVLRVKLDFQPFGGNGDVSKKQRFHRRDENQLRNKNT